MAHLQFLTSEIFLIKYSEIESESIFDKFSVLF